MALALVQAQASKVRPPVVWLLTAAAGGDRVDDAADAGMWGLARSARAEAQLAVLCLDVSTRQTLARGLAVEEPELVLRAEAQLLPRLAQASRVSESRTSFTRAAVLHLITGGTGGLGLLTARWLAQQGVPALLLGSRSGAIARDALIEQEHLHACGASSSVERCDTTEDAHIGRLVALAKTPLAGMWHAAGVIADGVLPRQSTASLSRVCAPKAHGAQALHLASALQRLDTCAFFSSTAALLGGAGQANYSAANARLDALSTQQHISGHACFCVQWGAWADIGMASRGAASERMATMEKAIGFGRISVAHGLGAMHVAALRHAPSLVAMVPAMASDAHWRCGTAIPD